MTLPDSVADPARKAGAGKLSYRGCTPQDVALAVPLICESGPIAFRYVFSPHHEDQALEFLRAAFVHGAGQFGCRNHLGVERDGQLIAVAALWDARANLSNTVIAARQIVGFYGFTAARVIWRGLAMERVVRPPVRDVGYIGHVAVASQCRGQGVGRALLAELLQRARAAGYVRAALDVAVTNPRARALYQSCGFTALETRHSALEGRWGRVVDYVYMEAALG